MMPRDAVRPLYRQAVEAMTGSITETGSDPLALLAAYCERLIPFPPFERWCRDFQEHPRAYDEDLAEDVAVGPSAGAPATVGSRPVVYSGTRWTARVRVFRDGAIWRGFISFQAEDYGTECRTSEIFCEEDLAVLQARFRSFDRHALHAFLRSCLPERFFVKKS